MNRRGVTLLSVLLLSLVSGRWLWAQATPTGVFVLDSSSELRLINARGEWVEHRGRRAFRLAPLAGQESGTDQELAAVIQGTDFANGTIDVDVSGARRRGYATDNASAFKGFVGISFRVRGDSAERFYIRPENARLPDQLFRNRTVQYESAPEFLWQRLRRESPGVYESYADMEAGGWTHLRIEVMGRTARLYINSATQPALIVNDLKLGEGRGAIALWTRISSDAYFSNLRVQAYPARLSLEQPFPSVAHVINGRADTVSYRGVQAIRLVPPSGSERLDQAVFAVLNGPDMRDGEIEIDVAGTPRPGAPVDARGFVGVSFRTGPRAQWSEVLYLRPTNGRVDDQARRNRAVQYTSEPDFPWHRLRQESPGVYEAYVDLDPGAWTRMRILLEGSTARLFVNGSSQPVLVVNDLKRGAVAGAIALWSHTQTDAYFGPLTIRRR